MDRVVKRLISITLTLLMIVSIFPAQTLADEARSKEIHLTDMASNEIADSVAGEIPVDTEDSVPEDDVGDSDEASQASSNDALSLQSDELSLALGNEEVSEVEENLGNAYLFDGEALSGAGTADDPYLISTENDLRTIDNNLQAYYSLSNSITMTSENWSPIGLSTAFSGTFDGNGYTISGLKVSSVDYAGLFGKNSGKVQNLTVDGTVSGRSYAGILVGYNSGTIQNCLTSGNVGYASDAGGLVGHSSGGSIVTSASTATVKGEDAGGLVGETYSNTRITNCYAQGNVSGTAGGGLIGRAYSDSAVFRNCYASGRVNDGSGGGLVGSNSARIYSKRH